MAATPTLNSSPGPGIAWPPDSQPSGPGTNGSGNAGPLAGDLNDSGRDPENLDYPRATSMSEGEPYREKQVKPNKVYIGGLPEHTRPEDLQNCFGKIGDIVNIELKVGYGFVEFDTREAAEESVAKYHEGFFMGNKIRVELSHGGGRTAKFAGDPGACFKCGQMGHWARECPASGGSYTRRPPSSYEAPLDRPPRDYPPPGRPAPREEYATRPPREGRYDYPPAPPSGARDYRRPPSPRDYRDYPQPPGARAREFDDYRRPPPPPVERGPYQSDYRRGYPPPPEPGYRGYVPPAAPPVYDRYDRRPNERYAPYPAPSGGRPRSPPPPPARGRDDYDRPPRDYPDYRSRPSSPPARYQDYPPRMANDGPPPPRSYRRRSESPPSRNGPPFDTYGQNGYAPMSNGAPPPSGPPRGTRDYPPPRNRDAVEPVPYRRP